MPKIHLLLKKEEINEEKMAEGNKLAVVLDILLATTTIVSALKDGAKEVIPVLNGEEAIQLAKKFHQGEYILAGELDAKPIDGFTYPSPTYIGPRISGKSLILSTTNGTVALRKAATAKKIYIASLLNNPSVADNLKRSAENDTILVVCSGNSGEFSLEDFYGAGHLIDCLLKNGDYELTDAAKASLFFYRGQKAEPYKILLASYVGRLLAKYNQLEDIAVAASKGIVSIVPVLHEGKVMLKTSEKGSWK